jgi:hypothetical protein
MIEEDTVLHRKLHATSSATKEVGTYVYKYVLSSHAEDDNGPVDMDLRSNEIEICA